MKQPLQPTHAPMALIATMYAIGIIFAHYIAIDLFVWFAIGSLLILIGVWINSVRRFAIPLAVMMFGGANIALQQTAIHPPKQTPLNAVVEICSESQVNSWGQTTCDVKIIEWSDGQDIHRSNNKIKATLSDSYPIGTRLSCNMNIKERPDNSYGRLLEVRGFEGYATLTECHRVGERTTIRYRAQAVQSQAVERIRRLHLDSENEIIAEAMILGSRSNMNSDLRDSYAKTGSSHILAVSGLHIGIVFILINFLLILLPMVRYGHIIKHLVAIILIWGFTFISGLSPSAVRAATMFSFVQVGLALSANTNMLNTISSSALIMLVINPTYLFDISFQLSFIAVLGITLWFSPLFSRIKSRSAVLNGVWGMLLVSICASIAVLPLVGYTFGSVSLVGVILSPVIVLLAHISIIVGLIWCMIPLDAIAPIVKAILQTTIGWQNAIIGSTSNIPFSAIDWSPSVVTVLGIYVGYIAFSIALRHTTRTQTESIIFE